MTKMPEICDYEGSSYRTDFWEGQGRDYEDQVERIAINRLLPLQGKNLLEIGAGFGRLTNLFKDYEKVVLLDYSLSQLEFARERYGDDGFLYVAANIYDMPFAPAVFDSTIMVRVLHHMQDPLAALESVRYVMQKNGSFLLEWANKQNIKAIARWLIRSQSWSPFDLQPVEYVDLNYDFHPKYVRQIIKEAQFEAGRSLTVSHFRINLMKRLIPTRLLIGMDSMAQLTGDLWKLSPSVFTLSEATGPDLDRPEDAFWKCPHCDSFEMNEESDRISCQSCSIYWLIVNGVYNFKEPLNK